LPFRLIALAAARKIESTVVVAHDYSVSVAQELLTRRAAGALAVDLRALHFMNGGVYPDLHRPQPAQVALLDTEQGPQISAAMNGELFMAGLAPTFPEGYDAAADAARICQSFHLHNGQQNAHLLIRYIEDRRENAERWTQVLETTDVPLIFVLGMLDPVSGAHMAERIRERLPDAPFTALEDVAHWPPLEAPERVAATLLSRHP
jgi:pimeloyl-ACP methyl ester carboxylesterase